MEQNHGYIIVNYPRTHFSTIEDWNQVQAILIDCIPNIRATSTFDLSTDAPSAPYITVPSDSFVNDGDLELAREIVSDYYISAIGADYVL